MLTSRYMMVSLSFAGRAIFYWHEHIILCVAEKGLYIRSLDTQCPAVVLRVSRGPPFGIWEEAWACWSGLPLFLKVHYSDVKFSGVNMGIVTPCNVYFLLRFAFLWSSKLFLKLISQHLSDAEHARQTNYFPCRDACCIFLKVDIKMGKWPKLNFKNFDGSSSYAEIFRYSDEKDVVLY